MPEPRRLDLPDLMRFAGPSDPTISPDGTRVVYTLRTVDPEADENVEQLWLAAPDTAARQLTRGRGDNGARFSPDGQQLAFLRGQDGPRQLWLMSFDGTEPEQLTTLPLGAGTPVWNTDSTRLAFSAPVDTDEEPEAEPGSEAQDGTPIVIDRPNHKIDGMGRLRGVRRHVFVLDPADGSVEQVTHGDFHAGTPSWSPDGRYLAYADALAEDSDLSGESAAYIVEPGGASEPRKVGPPGGVVADVNWTDDGILLVCAPDTEVRNLRLARATVDGEFEYLTEDLDRNVMPGGPGYPGARPQIANNGSEGSGDSEGGTLLFCARDRGCTHLYAQPHPQAGDGRRKLVDGARTVSGLSVAAGAPVAAAVVSTTTTVGEIVLVDLDTGKTQPLTSHTEEQLGDVEAIEPQERTFTVSDGGTVHGWLIRDPDTDGPAPLLVDVHGGPHNAWSPVLDPGHLYHQALAARGWTVLLLNPRGSDGYGEEFLRAAVGAWGEADENDQLEPVDQLVEEGIADPRRLALAGYSYGGYMACWLPTRTDRFGAVVAGGVVSDLRSMAGTSDAGTELLTAELAATFWDQPELVERLSPISRVQEVTSPTLILHGEADDRCPVGQAEQWFTALRTRGVPASLVLYPDASHLFILEGKPSQRADYNRRIVDWVVRHTRDRAPAGAASAAVPLDQERWQRRLRTLARKHGIVGASLAIRFGEQTAEAATGVLNKSTGVPATPDSLFQIGSISKVYTTTVALHLVEQGKLDLDAPVADVLPELVLTDGEVAERVTLRHLLTHTSGIDGDVFTDTGRGDDCVELYVAGLAEVAQNHPLGATWSYCNSGFVLVGRMIERVTGQVWDEAMRELLFRPLGLSATVTLPEEALCHGAALGHINGEPAPQWGIPRSSGPAGLIVASAREVLEFARMHIRGGVAPDGTRILSEQSVEQMGDLQVALPKGTGLADSWGLGWFRQDWEGGTVIGHDGGTIGQAAFLRLSPEHDLSVSLLTNGGPARDLYDELYREIFADLTGIRVPDPDRPSGDGGAVEGGVAASPGEDTAALTGVYERAGTRIEVFEEDGGLSMRVVPTGALAELIPEPPTVLKLVPESPGRFLVRNPGEHLWTPVVFYQPADGSPYIHFGGRAAPKTA